MKSTTAALASGDQIILGAAETEMISVEKKEFIFCLSEGCKDLSTAIIFPFDASIVDRVDEGCTHYVVEDALTLSLEVVCAFALKIKLVPRSFVTNLSRGIYTDEVEYFDHISPIEVKRDVLKWVNFMDTGLDPRTLHFLRLLGASISPTRKENSKNILLDNRFDALLNAIKGGDLMQLDVLMPKEPPLVVVVPELKASTESVFVPDSLPASMTDDTHGEEKENKPMRLRNIPSRVQIPSDGSDVKMVSTFVDLYRPARPISTPTNAGTNFKKFKKTTPSVPSVPGERKTSECIGLADMQPYKGVMETGGVNQSKSEAWLTGDKVNQEPKRVKIDDKPAATNATNSVEAPKFRSSFFSEALQFE